MVGHYCNVESWTGSCTVKSLGKLTLFSRYHEKYLMYMDTVHIPATKWQHNTCKFNNVTIQGPETTLAASSITANRTM
jgi:hypothetical protein